MVHLQILLKWMLLQIIVLKILEVFEKRSIFYLQKQNIEYI